MIADKIFITYLLCSFLSTASATAYGQRPKFFRAEHSATAEGENSAYGPTLDKIQNFLAKLLFLKCFVSATKIFNPKHVSGLVQVLIKSR